MERQNTMNQINQVLDKRCKPCEHYSANVNATICAVCPHGEKLKRLGDRLTDLTKERSAMKETKKEPFKVPTEEKPARNRPTMGKINDLKGKIAVLEKESELHKKESKEWQRKHDELLKGFESLKHSNSELTDQLKKKENQVDVLVGKASFSTDKAPEDNKELEKLQKLNANLQQSNKELEKQVKLYEIENKEAGERCNELAELYDSQLQANASLTEQIIVKDKEIDELTQSIKSVTLPSNNDDLARLEEVNGAMKVLLKDYFINQ